MKTMLIRLGWNKDKIYNVGGYWYYEGNNKVDVKTTYNDEVVYNFWKVTYHDIDFNKMHKVN